MGVRFNKRINILPWLKANVGKSGVSLTIGPKGKTLNIGSTGVTVNVSMGKGVSYNKRLLSWKKLNVLSWLGIGGAAASKVAKVSKKGRAEGGAISLDDAIAEAEGQNNASAGTTPQEGGLAGQLQEQGGCSWGCAVVGCLGTIIIVALVAVIVYLLVRDGTIDLGAITGACAKA